MMGRMVANLRVGVLAFGGDPRDLFSRVACVAPFAPRLPYKVTINHNQDIQVREDWLHRVLPRGADAPICARWLGRSGQHELGPELCIDRGCVSYEMPSDEAPSLERMLALVDGLPVEIMEIGAHESATPYLCSRFSDAARVIKLGMLFREAGHDRLVSRRWLDYGPWQVQRLPNDTTWVQFHARRGSAAMAWDEGERANERMGLSDVGGLLPSDLHELESQPTGYQSQPVGYYERADQSLTIFQAATPVSQREMLDLCVYRARARRSAVEPVERIRLLFRSERDALRHLHELWLRELECWYIDKSGRERRLDDGYQAERIVPEWVDQRTAPLQARPVRFQLALGLERVLHTYWFRDAVLRELVEPDRHPVPGRYELREVLHSGMRRFTARDDESGNLIVCAANGFTGALAANEAAPLLAKVQAAISAGSVIDVAFDPERWGLTLPAVIVPDPYPNQRPITFGALRGVVVHQVSDVLARVRSFNRRNLRVVEEMLRLCAEHRFVLSAVAIADRDAGDTTARTGVRTRRWNRSN